MPPKKSARAARTGAISVAEDIEDFVRLHREHGRLVGDATDPVLTGYRVTIECPCGVTFVRHVTAGEAAVDLRNLQAPR